MDIVSVLEGFFVQTGAGWVLYLLFALSFGTFAIGIERYLAFRRLDEDVEKLVALLDNHLSENDVEGALSVLTRRTSVGASIAAAGLRLAPRGAESSAKAMTSAAAARRKELERRLSYLGTLGNNAPFVGLFGTVIGVILAFHELGIEQGASSSIGSGALMSSIAEALVSTAVGIGVALPAVAIYNYFQQRIADIVADSECLSNLVVAYLSSTSEQTQE